jgi:hypothetical protein
MLLNKLQALRLELFDPHIMYTLLVDADLKTKIFDRQPFYRSDVPMKMIANSALLPFDDPPALAIEIVPNLLANCKCLQQLLSLKVLFVTFHVNDHWVIALIAEEDLEASNAYTLLGVLVKPRSCLRESTEVARGRFDA